MPDNLKSGVTRAHRYEPDVNPTYQDLAEHYGVAVLPARSSKPRDKAKVEAGVLLVERWILAALRHRRFFSLDELNEAISALLERLNDRPFQKLAGSRRTHFLSLERPALRPLPSAPYVFAEWKRARVGVDYHVEVEHHYYNVPYRYARSALGILRLSSTYGRERLEAAARRALVIGAFSLRSIESILRCGLDQHPLPESSPAPDVPITHANIRGAHYYTMLSPNQTTRYEC